MEDYEKEDIPKIRDLLPKFKGGPPSEEEIHAFWCWFSNDWSASWLVVEDRSSGLVRDYWRVWQKLSEKERTNTRTEPTRDPKKRETMNLRKYNFIKKYLDLLYMKGMSEGRTNPDGCVSYSRILANNIQFTPPITIITGLDEVIPGKLVGGTFVSDFHYKGTPVYFRFSEDPLTDPECDDMYCADSVTPSHGQVVRVRDYGGNSKTELRMYRLGSFYKEDKDYGAWPYYGCRWLPLNEEKLDSKT